MNAHQLVLSVGTNINHDNNMKQAFDLLSDTFDELRLSPIYKSQPLLVDVGNDTGRHVDGDLANVIDNDKNPITYYYNNVVQCLAYGSVDDVKKKLKDIEMFCGRDRTRVDINGRPVVTIDIDLLLYEDSVPHKDILSCAYVLRPLADLLPDKVHPVEQKSFSVLWHLFSAQLTDEQAIDPVDFVWRETIVSVAPPCMAI